MRQAEVPAPGDGLVQHTNIVDGPAFIGGKSVDTYQVGISAVVDNEDLDRDVLFQHRANAAHGHVTTGTYRDDYPVHILSPTNAVLSPHSFVLSVLSPILPNNDFQLCSVPFRSFTWSV